MAEFQWEEDLALNDLLDRLHSTEMSKFASLQGGHISGAISLARAIVKFEYVWSLVPCGANHQDLSRGYERLFVHTCSKALSAVSMQAGLVV